MLTRSLIVDRADVHGVNNFVTGLCSQDGFLELSLRLQLLFSIRFIHASVDDGDEKGHYKRSRVVNELYGDHIHDHLVLFLQLVLGRSELGFFLVEEDGGSVERDADTSDEVHLEEEAERTLLHVEVGRKHLDHGVRGMHRVVNKRHPQDVLNVIAHRVGVENLREVKSLRLQVNDAASAQQRENHAQSLVEYVAI